MLNIVMFFRGFMHKIGSPFVSMVDAGKRIVRLKDRLAQTNIVRRFGTGQKWAKRDPITAHDLEAPRVNANVYIATRAISDAIAGLPVMITTAEKVAGIERNVEDTEHPANMIFQAPNPEHDWVDIAKHIVKSYLNDGNALLTIESLTGPNDNKELWPQDPRFVDISVDRKIYNFGVGTALSKKYKRNQVIHIRDYDTSDPYWGRGRIQSVRDEIAMDYYANRFNSAFFKNGALFGLMFTPDNNLTEDQHDEIIDAMMGDVGGVEKAFGIFINRFAGKLENPGMKHTDIAFLDLLKSNREKIFGVFGLPPFRGGVMEYANYANALAQDVDFWQNTIAPILTVIESAFNKQLLWPIYGFDVRLKFDLDSVPALKGTLTEQIANLTTLKDKGIVNEKYVREQLDIPEDAKQENVDASPSDKDDDSEDKPTKEEKDAVENALFSLFKQQRVTTIANLRKMSANGRMMAVFCDPDGQATRAYKKNDSAHVMRQKILPIVNNILLERGIDTYAKFRAGVFSPNGERDVIAGNTKLRIESIANQLVSLLSSAITDVDKYDMQQWQLEKKVKNIFSLQRAMDWSDTMLSELVPQINMAINNNMKDNGKVDTVSNS